MPNYFMGKEVSPEMEEYLESIYRSKESGAKASTTGLARELGIAAPSVTEMLKKLAKKGLVNYKRYGGVELTPRGEEIGRGIVRKHRLIEHFLEFLGIRKKTIHKEACTLEHTLSDDVEMAIGKALKKGNVVPLASLAQGERGEILSLMAGGRACQRLADLGLTRGTVVSIARSAPLYGPIEVSVRRTKVAIGRGLASKILVRLRKSTTTD